MRNTKGDEFPETWAESTSQPFRFGESVQGEGGRN